MLRLNRAPAPSHARYAPARVDRNVPHIRRAQPARVTTAEPGPASKHLLGLVDTDWQGLMDLVRDPAENDAAFLKSVVDAVQSSLDEQGFKFAKVEFVGPTAAGIGLPDAVPSLVVQLDNYTAANHHVYLEAVQRALSSATPFRTVFYRWESASRLQGHSFQCFMYPGTSNNVPDHITLSVSGTKPPSPAELMDPSARAGRSGLNAALDGSREAFLQQQPALYKLAVWVVKYWAHHCYSGAPYSGARGFPTKLPDCDPLLELLVMKAFQQYMDSRLAAQATGTAVAPEPDSPQAAAALDTILLNFLQISASLSERSLIYWTDNYSKDTLMQVLASPRLVSLLRPSSGEACPLVIDPVNPTNNAALLVSFMGPSNLRSLAQEQLNAISSSIVTSLLQQRLLVAETGLREQQLQVERLQGKLDQQSSLLQVLVANQADTDQDIDEITSRLYGSYPYK